MTLENLLVSLPIDVFVYMLSYISCDHCSICPNKILPWETPYLVLNCDYNDSKKNGSYCFCSSECASHIYLPNREKYIKN